ncbi:UNVERIFIED_CONTAM: hypothetical protein Slati_2395700 [Sesamum latifolium]|uniref:Uncharacterized protein n=1 Tax=Sesamum latifolium TaxID=2727402 RepID=A0AAW2WFK5_9LAMI
MLIQSYKVPEGQLDSVARRMSFLKDKLKDWCYQASIQKNMKSLRGTIRLTLLCCDNNDFPTIIGESSEPRKRKKKNNDSYPRCSRRTSFRQDHGGPNPKRKPINLGKGPDQQGLHPRDLDEQMQDPQDKSLLEELSDEPIPEPIKASKTATVGPAEQKDTYLQTARRNMVNYANLKPRMTSSMQFTMASWYLFTNSRTFLQTNASMKRR